MAVMALDVLTEKTPTQPAPSTRANRPSAGPPVPGSEWLEADGRGGYASGTADLARTRRYHALLLASAPAGRFVLVNGLEAWVTTPEGNFALSSQSYGPGSIHPDGASRIETFEADPWPRWTFRLGSSGIRIMQEIFVSRRTGATVLVWRLNRKRYDVNLWVRPLFSGRDYHALHHENPHFRYEPQRRG